MNTFKSELNLIGQFIKRRYPKRKFKWNGKQLSILEEDGSEGETFTREQLYKHIYHFPRPIEESFDDLKPLEPKIKSELNKIYPGLGLKPSSFSSDSFNISKNEQGLVFDIPRLSTSTNDIFLSKLKQDSLKIISKITKIPIKSFNFDGVGKGYASTWKYTVDDSVKETKKLTSCSEGINKIINV